MTGAQRKPAHVSHYIVQLTDIARMTFVVPGAPGSWFRDPQPGIDWRRLLRTGLSVQ
jgi:hypothetical protein